MGKDLNSHLQKNVQLRKNVTREMQMKTGDSTTHLSKWLKSKKLTTLIAGKNAKWLILGLGQDMYRINLEHLVMPQRKEVMNPFPPTHTHTHTQRCRS